MTAPVCVSGHFRAVGNVLDIAAFMGRRLVLSQTTNASGDGSFTTQSTLPGTNHVDNTGSPASWLNNTGVDQMVRVEILPGSKYIRSSQPNLTFLRHRATFAVGAAPVAEDPNLLNDYDSEFGGGFDRITADGDTPLSGVAEMSEAISPYTLDDVLVPAGETLQVKYRCAHFSPDPWSETANNNVANYDATARSVTIQFWACSAGES